MSAKAEILVDHLDNVVMSHQSIAPNAGKQACYLVRGIKSEHVMLRLANSMMNSLKSKRTEASDKSVAPA